MALILDAGTTPPTGVVTPAQIAMYVGDVPRELLIFTGIADPEWDSNGDLDREEVIVRLGAATTPYFEWAASVSLASIHNNDSGFTFATDSATVDTDPVDGILRLHVPIAVQGSPSLLSRFSYNVSVLSDPIQAKVTGLISWDRSFGDPAFGVTQGGEPMFRVAVGQTVTIVTGEGMFPTTQFNENTFGLSSQPVLSGDIWVAAYEVDDVPLGQQWEIRPALLGSTLVGPPKGYTTTAIFNPDPQIVELSPLMPAASGVDFTMTFGQPVVVK